MTGWAPVAEKIVALLRSWSAAIAAFFAGKAAEKAKHDEAERKKLEGQHDAAQKEAGLLGDPDERDRLRDKWRDSEGSDPRQP